MIGCGIVKKLYIGDKLQIQCYKHTGKPHRAWEEAIILDEKKDYIVLGNDRTLVINADGNMWRTREPDILYFFKNKWFNVIAQLRKDGLYFKCNIASPYIIEEETVKWIDYDLDLRIFPSGDYKVLDRNEYKYHKKIMGYSEDLDSVLNKALDELLALYNKKDAMFSVSQNEKYYEQYRKLVEKNSNF